MSIWMGCRPSIPDSLPVIDRAPRFRNAIFAFGHGHTGMTGAPMTAKLVADLVALRKPAIDATPYRATRF
jgi:D-amino-acid dehydrogenase